MPSIANQPAILFALIRQMVKGFDILLLCVLFIKLIYVRQSLCIAITRVCFDILSVVVV